MTREELERLLTSGLTLRETGRRVDLDRSTVGKMAKRHGLVPPGRAKYAAKPIDVAELRRLCVSGATLAELAERFSVSPSTVRKHLGLHGLSTAHAAGVRKGRLARRTPGEPFEMTCAEHGLTTFQLDARGSVRCLQCRSAAVARRRRRVKRILVAEAGGACLLCGYDRCVRALHFHHVDPDAKAFALSRRGHTRALTALRAEAGKCVLLCSNCHAEVEDGITKLSK